MRLVPVPIDDIPSTHEAPAALLLESPSVILDRVEFFYVESTLKRPVRLSGLFKSSPSAPEREVAGLALIALVPRKSAKGEFVSLHLILPDCVAPIALTKGDPVRAFTGSYPLNVNPDELVFDDDARVVVNGTFVNYRPLLLDSPSSALLAACGPAIAELVSANSATSSPKPDPFAKK
jgi:hypothetical protein